MPHALEFVSGQMLLLTLITRLERLEEHKEYCVWTFWIQNTADVPFSHRQQGRIDFNTVNPSLSTALGKSLGSREIFRASGMDFPIPPSSWWSTDTMLHLDITKFVINQHQHLSLLGLFAAHIWELGTFILSFWIWQFFGIYTNCCVQLWGTLLLPPSQDNGFENIQTVSPLFCKFMSVDKFWLLMTQTF